MKWMLPIALLLALAVGAALRLPRLDARPMHHDEANQAYRFGILLESGAYTYDAKDHHGPSLYYFTLPVAWASRADRFSETSETTYRIVPVLFGLALLLCTPLLRSGIGVPAAAFCALFTAVSPAMAYYSRFYIQEMLLVFFTFAAIAAGWRSLRFGSRRWAALCGIAAGLMFATKETAVIAFAAMGGAALLCALAAHKFHLPLKNLLIAGCVAAAVAATLFSSFFTNAEGPLESILALKGYVARGTGIETEHVHPWYFYLEMLVRHRTDGGPIWSEALAFFLGLAGCTFVLAGKTPRGSDAGLVRFLTFYTLLMTLAYSALPYKTPWCILSMLHGWILLAGIGMATLVEAALAGPKPRLLVTAVSLLLLVLVAGTVQIARRTVFQYAADPLNPYVYAHTAPDFMNLVKRIGELESVSPKGSNLYIQVVADPDATWPLPFYLRTYPNTGYWSDPRSVPPRPRPDIVVTPAETAVDSARFLTEYYALRPDTLLAIHIDTALWERFMRTQP